MWDHVYFVSTFQAAESKGAKKKDKDAPPDLTLHSAWLYSEYLDRVSLYLPEDLDALHERLSVADRITEYGSSLKEYPHHFGQEWDVIASYSDDLILRVAKAIHPDAGEWDLARDDYNLFEVALNNVHDYDKFGGISADDKLRSMLKLSGQSLAMMQTYYLHYLFTLRDLSRVVDKRGYLMHKGGSKAILAWNSAGMPKVAEATNTEDLRSGAK